MYGTKVKLPESTSQNYQSPKKLRILHVVGGMSSGGIETWLMHVLRHIDRDRFEMDFLVHTTEECHYDDQVRALGSRIIPCPDAHQPWIYGGKFKKILREYGPYDIVHSHIHHFSGYVLRLAKQAGIPIRISHSHNDTSSNQAKAGFKRRLYLKLMRRWINRYSTIGLACSHQAAASFFGTDWAADPRWQALYYGINLKPFQEAIDPIAVRQELAIPEDAFVIGHVGRFVEQKNHKFLLEIVAEVAKREPKTRLVLIGDGSLRPEIEQQATLLGLRDCTIFAGIRPDVPRLMRAMNTFLLPSLFEGLGLVLIEAQTAGVPCIFSDLIPQEVDLVKPLVQRLSLSQSAEEWTEAILAQTSAETKMSQSEALALVETSKFNIETAVTKLENIYQAQVRV